MSTNVIKQFNKEEFSDNYNQCNQNDKGQLECNAIEHTSSYPNCYPTIQGLGISNNSKNQSVGQCVNSLYTKYINNNLQNPTVTYTDPDAFPNIPSPILKVISGTCGSVNNVANSINDYCNNAIKNTGLTAPEVNPLIYNSPQNGLGQVCPNDNSVITAPLKSKYTFSNTYNFKGEDVITSNRVGCHDMLSLKSKCTDLAQVDLKNLLDNYINGTNIDWNNLDSPLLDGKLKTIPDPTDPTDPTKNITILNKNDYFSHPANISKLNLLDKTIATEINTITTDDSEGIVKAKVTAMTTLSNLFKTGMCQIAKDNIENTKYSNTVFTIADWWRKNIYADGFQQNIYMICFFVCMYFKFKILSNFPIEGLTGLSGMYKYILPVVAIIWSVIVLILFNRGNSFLSEYFKYTMILFAIVICSSSIIRLLNKVKSQLYNYQSMKNLIILTVLIILFYSIITIMFDFRHRLMEMCIFFFLFFILLYTTFRKSNILPNYYVLLISLFLGIVAYFWVGIMKTDFYSASIGEVNKGFKIGWFYIIIFLLLLLIFSFNSPLMSSNKPHVIADYMKTIPLPKSISKLILVIYLIVAMMGDTFISVFCPQVTLALLVLFRLITNYWYEPINAVLSSLSGYYMNYGNTTPTTNKFIL